MKDIYLKNVATLKLDQGRCISCSMCVYVCPREVLAIENNTLEIINLDRCIECGACALNCPTEALSVNSGVGCASAMINAIIKGKEPECGCCGPSDDGNESNCC